MSRFFVDEKNIGERSIQITDSNDISHMTKVLRLKVGDSVEISDSVQWEYSAVIAEISKDLVELDIQDKQKFAREPQIRISLFQGIPKQGKMEMIIQKAVELGVSEIVPVFTDRSVVTDNGKMSKKIERWQKISDEAVKQCRRGIIPEVGGEITFKELLETLKQFDLVLFPYENEEKQTMKDVLRNLNSLPKKVGIIIGPEGGFSDKEADQIKKTGAECVTLGKTILRTETAGLAAIAMVLYELEL